MLAHVHKFLIVFLTPVYSHYDKFCANQLKRNGTVYIYYYIFSADYHKR